MMIFSVYFEGELALDYRVQDVGRMGPLYEGDWVRNLLLDVGNAELDCEERHTPEEVYMLILVYNWVQGGTLEVDYSVV